MPEFVRPHHRLIFKVLSELNTDFLSTCQCYFGGGTRIVLELNEYRYRSLDSSFYLALIGHILNRVGNLSMTHHPEYELYGSMNCSGYQGREKGDLHLERSLRTQ